jgi:hypothetical protein
VNLKTEAHECYSAENIMNCRIAVSLVDNMAAEGFLTGADRKKLYAVLARRHGIEPDSIYAV